MMEREIYLDNSATTPICKEALTKYIEISEQSWGNPSSRHARGHMAERVIDEARRVLLSALGARGGRILFTSGGTESNNLAILGRAHAKERYLGGRIITSEGEHSSVSAVMNALEKEGFEIVRIPTRDGVFDKEAFYRAANKKTVLVSVMSVNNETGAVYPIRALAAHIKSACPEAVLHVDATQGFLKLPGSPVGYGADLVTVSSHKIEGPKGVGALWVSDAVVKSRGLSPIVLGGGQEGGLRSGTENVPGIAAFAEATRIGRALLSARCEYLLSLRRYLLAALSDNPVTANAVRPNLPKRDYAPHIISLTVGGYKSEVVLNDLSGRGIYVSSGSACSSHDSALSPALLAFGLSAADADSTVRVSLSYRNTKEELDALVSALAEIVTQRVHR